MTTMKALHAARRLAIAATALLACALAHAAPAPLPALPTQAYLAYLVEEHVGGWEVASDGRAYRETLRIVSAQEKDRTTVTESFGLEPLANGWRWERRLKAGPIDRIERGTLVDGRFWRENDAGQAVASIRVPAVLVLPSMRLERMRAYATRGGTDADTFAYLDPSRLRPVAARLERCAVDAGLAGAAHCVALRL